MSKKQLGAFPAFNVKLFRFQDHTITVLVETVYPKKPWWVANDIRAIFGDKMNCGRVSYQEPQDRRVIVLNGKRTLLLSDRGLQRYLSRIGDPATGFRAFLDKARSQLPTVMPSLPNCEVGDTHTVDPGDEIQIEIKKRGSATQVVLPNGTVLVVYTPEVLHAG